MCIVEPQDLPSPARGVGRGEPTVQLVPDSRSTRSPQGEPSDQAEPLLSGRTAWTRNIQAPLRQFLRTETGGGAVLLTAAVAALIWANVDSESYESLWTTMLSIELDGSGVELDLREWVNSGLMAFFFFVIGLEARREFDLGDLRERRRLAVPVAAALGGMAIAVAVYLAFNAGSDSARGWGVAMSTDTALAVGLLALAGRRFPDRLRAFLAHGGRRRRPDRPSGHRDRVSRGSVELRALYGARFLRAYARPAADRRPGGPRLLRARRGDLGGPAKGRHRPDRRRPAHGPPDMGDAAGARAARARYRALSASSASSRRPTLPGRRASACAARFRRTSGFRRSTTRGRVT